VAAGTPISAIENTVAEGIDLELAPQPQTISGAIRDQDTGAAISGAEEGRRSIVPVVLAGKPQNRRDKAGRYIQTYIAKPRDDFGGGRDQSLLFREEHNPERPTAWNSEDGGAPARGTVVEDSLAPAVGECGRQNLGLTGTETPH